MNNILTRSVFGALYIALIALGTLYSPIFSLSILGILLAFCIYEICNLLSFENKWYIIGVIAGAAYLFYTYGNDFINNSGLYNLQLVNFLPALLFILAFTIIFRFPTELAFDSSKLIFSVVYVALPFALSLTLLKTWELDKFTIMNPLFFLFVLLWISDTFAFIIGKFFGSRKFTLISPNKTLEGLFGGMFFTVVAGIIIEYNFPELKGNWMIVGLLVGLVAPFGDLAESKLKRIFFKKDSGNLIPGHGGFLDRLDSFLPSAVIVYIYFLFI